MRNKILNFTIILLCFSINSVEGIDYLRRSSSLLADNHDSEFITSPDNSFTCGFYSLGNNTNAYWFAIWYTESKDKTVVWMANRDEPVNGRGSRVMLRRDGAMVLTDIDGSVVWETGTTQINTATRAELRNSGNLVLLDMNERTVWQSFDHPTDTLLPYQTFTKTNRLVSSRNSGSFSSGYFSLYFDSDNTLKLIYDGPDISSIYWPNLDFTIYQNGRSNYNNTRLAVLDDKGMFLSSDKFQFNTLDVGYGVKRRLTMDYDGNLRVYSLNNLTKLWSISWQAMSQMCNVHGLCGRNGICIYTPEPKCSCAPGYERVDPSQWREGCKPVFTKSCSSSMMKQVKFLELEHTDFYGYDLHYSESTTIEDCKNFCLEDCLCEAYSYRLTGSGVCFTKNALFNGYQSPDFLGSIFLKLPSGLEIGKNGSNPATLFELNVECDSRNSNVLVGSPSMYERISKTARWVYLYSFASVVGAFEVIIFLLGWWFLLKKHGGPDILEEGYKIISSQFRTFTYNELKCATKNFGIELGRGGFGIVYKGLLVDKRVVAIKKLEDSFEGEEEFWAEVNTIGKINHMNVVRMWGFCSEKRYRLLVYEYVQNSSLDKHLFHSRFLEWKVRFKIALGTARGLAYLHHECLEWVIHCDIKPENILLDENFEPKIADFGLAKLSQRGGPHSEFSRIRGTKGYMAPEWVMNLPITAKVDVYSYGVVILELVTGTRLSNWAIEDGECQESELTRFVRTTKRNMSCGDENWIYDVMDSRLNGNFNKKEAEILVKIGILCVEEDRNNRLKIDSVVQALQECE